MAEHILGSLLKLLGFLVVSSTKVVSNQDRLYRMALGELGVAIPDSLEELNAFLPIKGWMMWTNRTPLFWMCFAPTNDPS